MSHSFPTRRSSELTPAAKVVFADWAKYSALSEPSILSALKQTDVPATMQRIGRADMLHRCWAFLRLNVNRLYEVTETDET